MNKRAHGISHALFLKDFVMLKLDEHTLENIVSPKDIAEHIAIHKEKLKKVQQGLIGAPACLGWFNIPKDIDGYVAPFISLAEEVHKIATTMIVVGIGGSNRGSMAVLQALHRKISSPTKVVYAGDTLSAAKLKDILHIIENEEVVLDIIAKDFNTLEPGITFRMLRTAIQEKYGDKYNQRVIVTGSYGPGQLYELAQKHGYTFLEFPENIGGRFSVLTAVGLFPMAVAGVNIRRVMEGAKAAEHYVKTTEIEDNSAVRYAISRSLLFDKGFKVESLVLFEPDLIHLGRWWVQLFAESEGKTPRALFPTSFMNSDDLHAVGQYIQEGPLWIAETFLHLFFENKDCIIPDSSVVQDGFDYITGKNFDHLNLSVYNAALQAHKDRGVACTQFIGKAIEPEFFGYFFYYFFFVSYASGIILDVNPFDQNGVEDYKKNMYTILGKNK